MATFPGIEIFHDLYFVLNVCCTNLRDPALRAATAAMPAQLLCTMDLAQRDCVERLRELKGDRTAWPNRKGIESSRGKGRIIRCRDITPRLPFFGWL